MKSFGRNDLQKGEEEKISPWRSGKKRINPFEEPKRLLDNLEEGDYLNFSNSLRKINQQSIERDYQASKRIEFQATFKRLFN